MRTQYEELIMRTWRAPDKRGAVYVLALVTMLVGITLALALLRTVGASFMQESSRDKKQAAVNMAEAGVDYAFWQIHYKGRKLPFFADVALTTGSFHVDAVDDGNREASAMVVTSTGTVEKHKHTIKRVTLGPLPYHYMWCENREIYDGDMLTNTGVIGGFRANGLIRLDHTYTNITTGAWATGTITASGTVTPRYPSNPPIAFPAIDYNYYQTIATHVFPSDKTFTVLNYAGGHADIYVQGNVTVRGIYTGVYTIVATGDIFINGTLSPGSPDSFLALITMKQIKIETTCPSLDAVLYAHKSDKTGLIWIWGSTVITGSVATDDFITDSPVTMNYNPKLTLGVMKQLHLPGLQ